MTTWQTARMPAKASPTMARRTACKGPTMRCGAATVGTLGGADGSSLELDSNRLGARQNTNAASSRPVMCVAMQ